MEKLMETKQTEVKRTSNKMLNPVFLYIEEGCYIQLAKVFLLPDSMDTFVGHMKIWDDDAPFYFIFKNSDLYSLKLKGFKNCLFLPNMFNLRTDKKGKKYLLCDINRPNASVMYHALNTPEEVKEAKEHMHDKMFLGHDKDAYRGEAFQIRNN